MSYSGDAAEQIVRMSLDATQVAAKITGAGAKQVALLLYAILKDQKRTKGKMRLASMLRSGKPLKVFAVKDDDLQRFCKEAKKYGILYCVLKDRDAKDGITDIMVRADDASKVNRIFERFKLSTVDMASLEADIQREEQSRTGEERPELERVEHSDQEIDLILDAMELGDEPTPEAQLPPNPTEARPGKSPQSEPILENSENSDSTPLLDFEEERPSVKKEMQEIKATQQARKATEKQQPEKVLEHKAPPKKKKPKHMKER